MKFFLKFKFKKIKINYRKKNNIYDYTSNISLKNKNYFFRNKTHFALFKFVKYIIKSGVSKKIIILILKIFNVFLKFLKSYSLFENELNDQIEIRSYNFIADRNLYFINFFFKDMLDLLNPAFNLKMTKKDKAYRLETGSFYKDEISYVFPEKRMGLIFNWLFFYSNTFNDKKFYDRLLKSLFFTYFERRHSFLYLKKITIYIKLIELKKKKDNLGF